MNSVALFRQLYQEEYEKRKIPILERLKEFTVVEHSEFFYELCYCICTPQSKATNAYEVVAKLKENDFQNKHFNPVDILSNPKYYIRFHNNKSKFLVDLSKQYNNILTQLESPAPTIDKRNYIAQNVCGIGYKEASHFMRNIGYTGVAILDRHTLKHLCKLELIDSSKFPNSKNHYCRIESLWLDFAKKISVSIEEQDLLFWSLETGHILK